MEAQFRKGAGMKPTRELTKAKVRKYQYEIGDDGGHVYYFVTTTEDTADLPEEWTIGAIEFMSPVYPTVAARNAAMRKFKLAWTRFCDELDGI